MTDTPPPKRRFWQIHLSTAVVLMIVAAVIVWLNTIALHHIANPASDPGVWYSNEEDRWTHPYVSEAGVPFSWSWKVGYGWPFVAVRRNTDEREKYEIQWKAGVRNLSIAFGILMIVGCSMEFLIRRRSKP